MKSTTPDRVRLYPVLFALCALVWASGAGAATLYFDGPGNEGMSEASALASGLDILDLDIHGAAGRIDVLSQQGIDGVVISPAEEVNPFDRPSSWTIESLVSLSVIGDAYLLFATADNYDFSYNGTFLGTTSYNADEVGLKATTSDGWAIVRGDFQGQTVYYLGISLGSLLETVNAQTTFDVNYFLDAAFPNNVFDVPNTLDRVVALPQLELMLAYNVVPEPGTGLLMGLGLIGLAAARRGQR